MSPSLFCMNNESSYERDFIVLINEHDDYENYYNEKNNDAIFNTFLTALKQKAAPILVSGDVWRHFIQLREKFDIARAQETTPEHKLYQIYKKINNFLRLAPAGCINDAKILEDFLVLLDEEQLNNPEIQENLWSLMWLFKNREKEYISSERVKSFKQLIKNVEEFKNLTSVDENDHTFENNLFIKFAAFSIELNSSLWDVYTWKHNLYLLVPATYARRISDDFSKSIIFDEQLNRNLAILGFKSNHLESIDIDDVCKLPYSMPEEKIDLSKGLPWDELLITKTDVDVYPFTWNIFLSGHGQQLLSCENQTLLHEYYTNLNILLPCLARLNKLLENDNPIDLGNINLLDESYGEIIKKYGKDIKEAKEIIKKIYKPAQEAITKVRNISGLIQKNILKNPDSGMMIAGLSLRGFNKMLHFFDQQVHAKYFFYKSCYSGAYNLLLPFNDIFMGNSSCYHYAIVGGTMHDHFLSQQLNLPQIGVCSDDNEIKLGLSIEFKDLQLIEKKGQKAYWYYTPSQVYNIDFENFFLGLHQNNGNAMSMDLVKLMYQLPNDNVDPRCFPVIRMPYKNNFEILYNLDDDAHIMNITNESTSFVTNDDVLCIDDNKNVLLFNTSWMPVSIVFDTTLRDHLVPCIYEPNLPQMTIGYYCKQIAAKSLELKTFTKRLFNIKRGERPSIIRQIFLCDEVVTRKIEKLQPVEKRFAQVIFFNNPMLPGNLKTVMQAKSEEGILTGCLYTRVDGGATCCVLVSPTGKAKRFIIKNPEAIKEYKQMYDTYKNDLKNQVELE